MIQQSTDHDRFARILGFIVAVATLLCSTVAPSPASADTVATISYSAIARPTYVPATFVAAPGSTLRFLAITALDGSKDDAALCEPTGKNRAETTLVVQTHGSGSNFYASPNGPLCIGLAARGYAVLSINNRAHDAAINTENFFDIRRDIEAAVATGKGLGYKRLVLSGHSLATIHLMYYAATTWDSSVKAILLESPFANLPWKTRNVLVQNDTNYAKLTQEALAAQRAGLGDTLLADKMGFFTGEQVPVTARHFLTYRDDVTSAADGTYWIKRVPYPVFITRNQADGVILPWEPYELISSAHAAGSLVPSIEYTLVPDKAPPSVNGHSFVGNEGALVSTIAEWLGKNGL